MLRPELESISSYGLNGIGLFTLFFHLKKKIEQVAETLLLENINQKDKLNVQWVIKRYVYARSRIGLHLIFKQQFYFFHFIFLGGKGQPTRGADNITAICEPIV
jgi:hypothetical protein